MRSINVLCLYPQVEHFAPLATYSFIAEEMMALAGLPDIRIFGVSACRPADFEYGGVTVRAVPGLLSNLRGLARDAAHCLGNAAFFPRPTSLRDVSRIWQCCRLERFIAETARRDRIDIIHSHGIWPESTGGSLAASRTGLKLLQTVRGGEILVTQSIGHGRVLDPFHEKMIRKTLGLADRVLGVSQAICDRAVELGAAPGKAARVAKGVDLSRFRPGSFPENLRKRFEAFPRPFVLSVGGLTRRKGVDDCLRALAVVSGRGHPFTLLIIGEGEEKENLLGLSRGLGIGDRVVFLGNISREEISGYYGISDIFCLAALQDAAPNVVLEAMAAGLPVASTRVGGIPEYVADGATGLLVRPGDVPGLAEKLEALIRDAGMRKRLGAAGRKRAEEEFSYQRMIDQIAGEYRALAGKNI